jgi:hypothetical protein
MIDLVSLAIDGFFIYLGIGLVFSLWFVSVGAKKIDEGMEGTPFHFKLILIPGSILIWPVMLIKSLRK